MNFNFALILFWLMVGTGAVWLADRLYFRRQRHAAAQLALQSFEEISRANPNADEVLIRQEKARLWESNLRQPAWIEFSAGFFPVILIVFALRSFLFEPFRIPSGSMIPTLLVGDLILVNKFAYGVRLPVVNKKIITVGEPQRGDIMVFRYPKDPSVDYIKRVIGVPGDKIHYENKHLVINGQPVPESATSDYFDKDKVSYSQQFIEKLPSSGSVVEHAILKEGDMMAVIRPEIYEFQDNCEYTDGNTSVTCTVPAGHYFMMGDNRDNSADSRYWGFVPEENIVGKAFFIWMNFGNIRRIGSFH